MGVAEGWYPDPQDASQVRWWDGAQWTEHVQAAQQGDRTGEPTQDAAAGWYPDPNDPNYYRYWDGTRWTDDTQVVVLFDSDVLLSRTLRGAKHKRLRVTTEDVWWGETQVLWDEVAAFSDLVTKVNGIESRYAVTLTTEKGHTGIGFSPGGKRDGSGRRGYDAIREMLYRTIRVDVLEHLFGKLEAGEPIRLQGVRLSPEGFCHEEKSQETIPWADFAGVSVGGTNGLYLQIRRLKEDGKSKMAVRVPVDTLRAWVGPPVIEEHARRYGRVNA